MNNQHKLQRRRQRNLGRLWIVLSGVLLVAGAYAAAAAPTAPGYAAAARSDEVPREVGHGPRRADPREVREPNAGEPSHIAAGTIVRMKDLPPSKRPEHVPPRFHLQGEVDASGTGVATPPRRVFKTEAASPPSPVPGAVEQRAAGGDVRLFTGATSVNATGFPPDMNLAVGPNHVVEVINAGFHVFNKMGGVVQPYTNFANLVTMPANFQGFLFDPRIVYDPYHRKFVMLILGRDDNILKSYAWIIVSTTSDPTDGWCVRPAKDVTEVNDGLPTWLDFAGLGTDADGVYITGNQILFGGGTRGADLRSYPAEMLTTCNNVTGWRFPDIQWPSGGDANSLQPALAHTVNGDGETFFVNTQPASGDKVMLTRLSGDRGSFPSLSKVEIDIPAYNSINGNVDQPGSVTDLEGGASKALSAVYVNRRVFFSLADDVLNDGRAAGWLTVKLNTNTNTKEWHHQLWSGPGFYYFYPALTVQGTGVDNNVAVFGSWTDTETTMTADTRFASGLFRLYENQPTSSTGYFQGLIGGTSAYVFLDSRGRNRWGDYSGAAYDWTCGHAWGVVQTATAPTTWSTSIAAREFDSEGACPMLYVMAPAADAQIDSGTLQTIEWQSDDLPSSNSIYIFLEVDGEARQIAGPLSSTTTSWQWNVDETDAGTNARIFVGSWGGGTYEASHWGKEFEIRDRTTPSPDPMTWQAAPQASSSAAITMTVNTATDGSGDPTAYYFDFINSPTNGTGGTDWGWVGILRTYLNMGLSPNHRYCYRARARDLAQNQTGYTPARCAFTLANQPTLLEFVSPTGTTVEVHWKTQGNSFFTKYLLKNVATGEVSGWIGGSSWISSGLQSGQSYPFRIKARNGDDVETDWVDLGVATTMAQDEDGDGVPRTADNCTNSANADQRDTDGDGIGNMCDGDLTQDCLINAADLGLMKSVFFSNDDNADLNGDGGVNFADLAIVKQSFFGTPGPSGIANLCAASDDPI